MPATRVISLPADIGAAAATDLTAETSARQTADTTLTSAVSAESTARTAGDATNATAISSEATTARAAESTLTANVATNTSALSAETTARQAADTTLTASAATNAANIATNTAGLAAEGVARAAAAASLLRRTATAIPPRLTLMGGHDDETLVCSNCTASVDLTNFKIGDRGWLLTMAGAVTATAYIDPPGTEDPLVPGPAQALGLWVWLADVTKISSVSVQLFSDSAATTNSNFTTTTGLPAGQPALLTGWNRLRWLPADGVMANGWATIYRVRVTIVTTAATTLTVGQVWLECPPKARFLFIHDGGYPEFLNGYTGGGYTTLGYPDLKARGIPVTWAIDCGLLGDSTHITEAQVAAVAAENGNEISVHGWDGTTQSSMTAAQLRAGTMKTLKWMSKRGYDGRIWRAAWLGNVATQAPACSPLLLMAAMYGADNVERIGAWPPKSRYNLIRFQLHTRDTATVDSWFTALQATHGLLIGYTHRVDPAGSPNATPAEWLYLLSKLDAAIAAGWLECVTLTQLLAESGTKIRRTLGDSLVEYYDLDGTRLTLRLP